VGDIEDVTSRVYEGGEFHYSFRCPSCGLNAMRITGYNTRLMADDDQRNSILISLVCSSCGDRRSISSLPVSSALSQLTVGEGHDREE
jgi:hypothetical protein